MCFSIKHQNPLRSLDILHVLKLFHVSICDVPIVVLIVDYYFFESSVTVLTIKDRVHDVYTYRYRHIKNSR